MFIGGTKYHYSVKRLKNISTTSSPTFVGFFVYGMMGRFGDD